MDRFGVDVRAQARRGLIRPTLFALLIVYMVACIAGAVSKFWP